jgi:hypothetical protein
MPDFDPMIQSEAQWKRSAKTQFDREQQTFLEFARTQIEKQVASRGLFRVKPSRGGGNNSPPERRYEWAAQRFLMGLEIKEIAQGKYNAGQVAQAISAILNEADLGQ